MKKDLGFLETLKISAFDFKSYIKFIDMPFLKVILNRILFVFLISLFYIIFLNRDIKSLNEFNTIKHEIFQDINYSNGTLHIQNSPTIFKNGEFLLIGDTREEFNINEFSEYSTYKTSLVLLKNSFILKDKLRENEFKYSDFLIINKDKVLNKDVIFNLIDSITGTFKYLVYLILPLFMIFNYFILAFLTSFFAFFCTIITRIRVKFTQVYKMILFAQGIPFLIISIFEIIAKFKNVDVLFPAHILEFLTLMVFLISIFSIKKDTMKKILNNRK